MRAVRCGGGNDFTQTIIDNFKDVDAILTWNGFLPNNCEALDAYYDALKRNIPVLCIETPLIGREIFENKVKDVKKQYFRLGLMGVCAASHASIIRYDNRLDEILINTEKEVKPWRGWEGDCVVYAMQIPGDMSLVGLEVWSAAKHDLVQIRYNTKLPVFVTISPYITGNEPEIKVLTDFAKEIGVEVVTGGSKEFLDHAQCFVTHSSGTAVDCMLAGVPCITLHHGSPCYYYTNHGFNYLNDCKINDRMGKFDRNAALNSVAGYQFNIEEFLEGWPIQGCLDFHNERFT